MEWVKVLVIFVDGFGWMDVDIFEEIKRVRRMFVRIVVKGMGDGFVSRYLNRRILMRVSELLVEKVMLN